MDRMTGVMSITGEGLAEALCQVGVPTNEAQSWHEDWRRWLQEVDTKTIGIVEGSLRLSHLLERAQIMTTAAVTVKYGR